MRVISLFSGAGGLDLGFIQAGHEVVWAVDNWRDAVETYRMNLGEHIVLADIEKIRADEIPDAEIVVGGFPCQGFSVANPKRNRSDKRNRLYLEFVRILEEKHAPFFLAENVKGILSLDGGAVFRMIVEDFKSLGYKVRYSILNAADYGVPQQRERVFLLGIRSDTDACVGFPPPRSHSRFSGSRQDRLGLGAGFATQPLRPWMSIGEALDQLPEPGDNRGSLQNHECSEYKLTFTGYLGHRKVDPRKPSPTITARGDGKGGVVVLPHPNGKRRLSPRETAIIQSFPIDYRFFGCKTSVYRQVANAVPPVLARAIAEGLHCRIG